MSTHLHTISIDETPVLVLNVDADHAVPDFIVTDPRLLQAQRITDTLLQAMPPEVHQIRRQMEIDEALDTWLGDDLQTLQHEGAPIWDGDRSRLHVREAHAGEAARWRASYEQALCTGEQDAGNESWGAYLIEVSQ